MRNVIYGRLLNGGKQGFGVDVARSRGIEVGVGVGIGIGVGVGVGVGQVASNPTPERLL